MTEKTQLSDEEREDYYRRNRISWLKPAPFKFKSNRHRQAWRFLNNLSSQPAPDPELTWWAWSGRIILLFIDWLNRLAGADKPKHKTDGEQMATLDEWFDIKTSEDVPDNEVWLVPADGSEITKIKNIRE